MSFPEDGRPRFVTASVTGYPNTPQSGRSAGAPSTVWSVLDRAYCHREIARFAPQGSARANVGWATIKADAALAARQRARELNERDAA